MKKPLALTFLSCAATLSLLVAGCASPDVNPQVPKAKTGYADIYCAENGGIYWEVRCAEAKGTNYKTIYSELEAPGGDVLRLALAPGHHRLRVSVLNHVIKTPAEFDVEIVSGKITPVRIAYNDVGDVVVQSKQDSIGASAAGRYRRPVTLTSDEANMYDLNAEVAQPIAYLPKQKMSYWRAPKGGK